MSAKETPADQSLPAELLFEISADLDPPQEVGSGPRGVRQIVPVTGGSFSGPRLEGEVLAAAGADWFVIRDDGVAELDVRITLRTNDGALIYMSYWGVLDASPDVMQRLQAGEDVDRGEFYFRTAPRFETGAEAYRWLNNVVAVGFGTTFPGGVRYTVYAIR